MDIFQLCYPRYPGVWRYCAGAPRRARFSCYGRPYRQLYLAILIAAWFPRTLIIGKSLLMVLPTSQKVTALISPILEPGEVSPRGVCGQISKEKS